MTRQLRLTTAAVLLALGAAVATAAYRYLSPPAAQPPHPAAHHPDDTLRVAIVGDSWAYMHQPHDTLLARQLTALTGRPAVVRSHGVCGLTSKEIYQRLTSGEPMGTLASAGCDVCVVSAGINDTYRKMTTTYYRQSMALTVAWLQGNGVYPLLIEIPDYDIHLAYRLQTADRRLLRKATQLLTGTPTDCKQLFRDALSDAVGASERQGRLGIVGYREWNGHYAADLSTLYRPDGMHLNDEGYRRLDSAMARHISHLLPLTSHQ